jgi:hypothetical protein
VTGSYTRGAPGTITIDVPSADVGNPAGSALPLYSVTAIAATQAELSSLAGGLAASVFNQIDASAPYGAK